MSKRETRSKKDADARPAAGFNISRKWVVRIILASTFLAFSNTVFNGFAYDDTTQILKNEFIRSFANLPKAMVTEAWFWRAQLDKDPGEQDKPTTPYYRPVFTVYLMVGWAIFRDSAFGWHFANIVLHMLAVYFVFLLLEKVTADVALSGLAALLFALHPLRSESVAWISGLTDPLLAICLVPSFYFYVLFREGGRRKHLLYSLGLFLLAVFEKEPGVGMLPLIAGYELFLLNREKKFIERLKPVVQYGGMFLLVAIFYFAMRFNALGFVFQDSRYVKHTLLDVVLTIPIVIWKYLGLLVWPVNLSIFHATPIQTTALSARFIIPAAALILVGWLLRGMWKSVPGRFALVWFIANLIPVLNLAAFDANFLIQERYLYLPAIGFSLLLAMALMSLKNQEWIEFGSRGTVQAAATVILCVVLGGKALSQNAVWKDDETLYSHGAEVANDQMMPHYILGFQYLKQQQWLKVVPELEACNDLSPNNKFTLTNLTAAHLQVFEITKERSHLDRAIALAEQGLRIDDQNPLLWDSLGKAYAYDTDLKNLDRARSFMMRGYRLQPGNAMINFHVGATFLKQGNIDAALLYLEQARQLAPGLPDTYKSLAYAYENRGRLSDAVNSLESYCLMQPNALDIEHEKTHLETLRMKANQQPLSPTISYTLAGQKFWQGLPYSTVQRSTQIFKSITFR